MKRHLLKKEITTVIFIVMLFVFAIINFIHTFPYFKEMEMGKIENMDEIDTIIQKVDSVINENIYGKYAFIEAQGIWNLILGKNEIDGFGHIKDKNGYLHYTDFWNDQNDDINGLVQTVIDLKDYVKQYDTEVIVLMPPVKDDINDVSYDKGMPYCDKNWVADEYLDKLQKAGINTLDFRKVLKESGLTYKDMFYVTDHHWTTEAVFEAYKSFVNQMDSWYNLNLDPDGLFTDINNYNILKYTDSTLGSHGRDTGIVYAGGLDDFTLMYPKFYTNFKYEWCLTDTTSVLNGRFEETLVSTYNIVNSNIYEQDKYAAYMNAINTVDRVENKMNTEAPKVLFLRDSCTSPFAAFAALNFSQTDLIWTLKLDNDLEDYVDLSDYDYIFVSLYPDSLKNSMFKFNVNESK